MEYRSLRMDGVAKTLTKEQARSILESSYNKDFVDDIIDNEKSFCLRAPWCTIYTYKDGFTPMPGFFGVCE